MTIGQRIKARRIELGLSVDELAARLGKDRATVYRYEKDEIKNFPVDILEPLAHALSTTPADLMGYASNSKLRSDEEALLKYYNLLNDIGRQEAFKRVQELTELDRYTVKKGTTLLNA